MPLKRIIQPALAVNPSSVILYGLSKSGKTTSLVQLDDHVILDLRNETDFVECNRVKIKSLDDLKDFVVEINTIKAEENDSYKYIIVDNATEMEDFMAQYALEEFKDKGTSIKEEEKAGLNSIFDLARGAGELWYRDAWKRWLKILEDYCDTLILICHVKDSEVAKVEVKDEVVDVMDIQLRGKLATILPSLVSATGFVFRDITDTMCITFKSNTTSTGSRCRHLANKTFQIMPSVPEGEPEIADWSKVFINNNNNK